MNKKIYCKKLKCELDQMENPPFPGELGIKIWNNISKEAWESWIKTQTIIINENRLNLVDYKSRKYLKEKMQSFLFEEQSE